MCTCDRYGHVTARTDSTVLACTVERDTIPLVHICMGYQCLSEEYATLSLHA